MDGALFLAGFVALHLRRERLDTHRRCPLPPHIVERIHGEGGQTDVGDAWQWDVKERCPTCGIKLTSDEWWREQGALR